MAYAMRTLYERGWDMTMTPLFSNGIAAVKLALEDYGSNRYLSSMRNLYAGILLLLREELRRLSPEGINDVLLKKDISLSYDSSTGKIIAVGKGKALAGCEEAAERFRIMGKPLDPGVERIILGFENAISDLESLYPKPSVYAFDSMISDACDFLIQILDPEYLDESPEDLFGDGWKRMQSIGASVIEKRNAYHKELMALRSSLDIRSDLYEYLAEGFRCPLCGSPFFTIEGSSWEAVFHCIDCGNVISLDEVYSMFSL